MKRWWQAFWNSLKHVIPVATSIEAVAGGVIECKTHKSFYALVGEHDRFWFFIIAWVVIAILGVFYYSLRKKYPGKNLKELRNIFDNWIYFFSTDSTLERDSVVEIRKRIGRHGDEPFALAFVDRVDDHEKSTMLLQHIAIYDSTCNKYIKKEPQREITNKKITKDYYYRSYISRNEIEEIVK